MKEVINPGSFGAGTGRGSAFEGAFGSLVGEDFGFALRMIRDLQNTPVALSPPVTKVTTWVMLDNSPSPRPAKPYPLFRLAVVTVYPYACFP
jgi:hypothetical protein